MEAAERLAVVKIHPAIRDIQNMQRCRESVAEILADGEIEACVLRPPVTPKRILRLICFLALGYELESRRTEKTSRRRGSFSECRCVV
jgi:hypothetical protein